MQPSSPSTRPQRRTLSSNVLAKAGWVGVLGVSTLLYTACAQGEALDDGMAAASIDDRSSGLAPRRVIQGNTVVDIVSPGGNAIEIVYESYCDIVVDGGACATSNACEVACPTATNTAAYENMGVFLGCFDDLFGRDSYDGNGGELRAVVETSAFLAPLWSGNEAILSDPWGVYEGDPASSLDTVVHEFTHGVILHTVVDPQVGPESYPLNEGIADVFAAVCSWWNLRPAAPDASVWQISEDVLSNPNDLSDPASVASVSDHYLDDGNDKGVVGLAFYLLSEGGSHPRPQDHPGGPNVVGIGIESAARIFYRALELLPPNATFSDMRIATNWAAFQLYPSAPGVMTSVNEAWNAVGVMCEIDPDPGSWLWCSLCGPCPQ
ncbi:MAG: M4 family metallopeptidase [Deltaproteobacteria bacterium]|nr:M4 family metallopeptidase [Deltaproteobacteria bacterium]